MTKIIQVGNSLGITIPKHIMFKNKLNKGDIIMLDWEMMFKLSDLKPITTFKDIDQFIQEI
jgi:antitoxin component of MazEF toxin-antitoxin module